MAPHRAATVPPQVVLDVFGREVDRLVVSIRLLRTPDAAPDAEGRIRERLRLLAEDMERTAQAHKRKGDASLLLNVQSQLTESEISSISEKRAAVLEDTLQKISETLEEWNSLLPTVESPSAQVHPASPRR